MDAEAGIERRYAAGGAVLAARRWRGLSGEVDLIFREGDVTVFVEVKRGRSFDDAARRLGPRQIARITGAAAEYMDAEGAGSLGECRFDLALVDATGRTDIRRNALAA